MKVQLARSTEREQHLLDAATAVFVQQGFYAARMEEIARAAGLSKRTLARSFRSKDLLIAALLHRFYAQGVQELHLWDNCLSHHTDPPLHAVHGGWVAAEILDRLGEGAGSRARVSPGLLPRVSGHPGASDRSRR